MPYLLAPGLQTEQAQQPQSLARLDPNHWLTKDVTVAINGATPRFNAATGESFALTAGGSGFTTRQTSRGTALWTPNGGWADFAVNEDWAGPNTIIALCRVNSTDASYGGIFSKNSTGTNTQFAAGRFSSEDVLYIGVDNATIVKLVGSTVSALTAFSTIAFTHPGGASTPAAYSLNGVPTGTSVNLGTQPTGSGVLRLGGERAASAGFDSDVDWINFIRVRRVLSTAEIAAVSRDIWRVWEPDPIYWFFPGAAGGTAYFQDVAGSITAAGALTKRTNKSLVGSSTYSGNIEKLTNKSYSGSMTAAGAVAKRTAKSFAGSITGSGALSTMILFTADLAGSLTPSGAISKMTIKALAGASTLAGAITKKTFRTLDGNITVAGVVTKLTKKAFSGAVTVAGALTESYQVLKSLAGSITPSGALGAVYIAFVAGVLKLLSLMGVGQ